MPAKIGQKKEMINNLPKASLLTGAVIYVLGLMIISRTVAPLITVLAFQPVNRQSETNEILEFVDVTERAGLNKTRQCMDKLIGQAWGDVDGDGWLDLYVTDCAGPNTLYRNTQRGNFEAANFPEISLTDAKSSGALFTDYDNDGWVDLYVLNVGINALFHNDGGKSFSDVTDMAGVGDHGHSKTAAWGDYDQDGFVDLYVANWSCSPDCLDPIEGDRDSLYHNNGDGTFTDVTDLLDHKVRGAGFVASFADFDNDGDPDIYVVNDAFINPIGNVLWRNDGPGCEGWCFTDISLEANANIQLMGMGLATADYDNDGDLDFYISNAGVMHLLQNQGDGAFVETADFAGVSLNNRSIGWGTVFLDVNNDGWRDLYLALSAVLPDEPPANPLFLNLGDGTFANYSSTAGLGHNGRTLGVAYADYDNDGWVDLVIGNFDQGYALYHNEAQLGQDNDRLAVQLVGSGPVNRDGIGAKVYLHDDTGRTQMQEIKSGSGLGAGNALALYFGIGQSAPETLTVIWPDGVVQKFSDLMANHKYIINYSNGLDRNAWLLIWTLPFLVGLIFRYSNRFR